MAGSDLTRLSEALSVPTASNPTIAAGLEQLHAAEDIAERAIWTGHPNYKLQQLAAQDMRREGSGRRRR